MLLYVQELQQQKADFVIVIESFFNGTFEAKNVDRNRLLVRGRDKHHSALSSCIASSYADLLMAAAMPILLGGGCRTCSSLSLRHQRV